jgi:hypothetical protein
MAVVLTAVWIALAAGIAATLAGVVYAVVHALRAWRTFRRTSRNVRRGIADVLRKGVETEVKAVAATENSTKLTRAIASLQESLAVLAVLRAAFSEATAGVDRVRGAVPRK